jgi:Uma2 family endonuclease
MPELKKAELIEGVVYMPSPVTFEHGEPHFDLIAWLGDYRKFTPGVVGGDNSSLRLDLANMPQPDAYLRILQTHGGRARVSRDRYIEGSPELVGEVAVSSANFDLTVKLPMYRRNGVLEYVVWRVLDQAIDWFVLHGNDYERLPRTPEGYYRSEVLPGLWLDPDALAHGDMATVGHVAQLGIGSPEHRAFVEKLAAEAARRRA